MEEDARMTKADWATFAGKGTALLQAWIAPPGSKAFLRPSPWTNWTDAALAREGWLVSRDDSDDNSGFSHRTTMNSLDTRDVPATWASYTSRIDVARGIIVAVMNNSPQATVGNLPSSFLQRWSDVVFLQWAECFCTARAKGKLTTNLNHVVQYRITNDDTLRVIAEVQARAEDAFGYRTTANLTSMGASEVEDESEDDDSEFEYKKPPMWPGLEFPVNEKPEGEVGRALLGTPNGKGVAYLLIQHKSQLGDRKIGSVRVWSQKTIPKADPSVMMMFNIVVNG